MPLWSGAACGHLLSFAIARSLSSHCHFGKSQMMSAAAACLHGSGW